MNKELFGVFGGRPAFERVRSPAAFDRVVEGPAVTVGVRDDGLDVPGWTQVESRDDGCCVVWGEAYVPDSDSDPATWLLDQYPSLGAKALSALNGSFLAVVDDGFRPVVAGDPLRTRECFFTDLEENRVFGTDPTTVVTLLEDPSPCRQSLVEFVHLGVALGDRTLFEDVARVPFDGYLESDDSGALDRFVYDAREFNYANSLARRLQRAIDRRSGQPGRTGVMLSAGYDSRVLLAELDDVDRCYTVGRPDSDEVSVSRQLADQHGADHHVLDPADGYLNTRPETIQYGQSIKESLQVHQAVDGAHIDVDSLHHGLLFDTLLSGHFLPRRTIDVLDYTFPLRGLESDPDVAETLLFDNFGFWTISDLVPSGTVSPPEDSVEFCRDAIETQYDRLADRFDSPHDAIAAIGIQNQPAVPFHTHLADNSFATFLAADAELIDWHLTTPPEHRNKRTYRRALEQVDASLLSPRPPDRPHDSYQLNQVEQFLRRALPGVAAFESPWPDRAEQYDRSGLDDRLFDEGSDLREFPPRLKLRLHDAVCWFDSIADGTHVDPVEVFSSPLETR